MPPPNSKSQGLPDVELEFQDLLRSGAVDAARTLLSRHPELSRQKCFVLDLAYEEYCREAESGQRPDPDAYYRRFPGYKSSVRRLIAMHSFLHRNEDLMKERQGLAWPEPGQVFLGFTLEQELGRGTFARVFQASEPALGNRKVAVKVSLQGSAEAEILGRLRHAHVVPVHSVREDPVTGLAVVCMPFLGRATLEDVLDRLLAGSTLPTRARMILDAVGERDGPDSDKETPDPILRRGSYIDGVIYIGIKLAEALTFVHQQGIGHRDLKPTNILMTPSGRPMLLDFNLSVGQQTDSAVQGGTLPYMSPEELRAAAPNQLGEARPFDPRSDLFSLGTILYELLTTKHPFGSTPADLPDDELRERLLQRQRAGPRPLRESNPQVDRLLAKTVERCLAYDPAERPSSAKELARRLQRCLRPTRRARRWLFAHPRASLCTTALLCALTSLGGYAYSQREPYPLRQLHAGQEAYRRGDYDATVQCCTRTLQVDASLEEALFWRGLAFREMGQLEPACGDFMKDYKVCPDGRRLAYMGYFFSTKISLAKEPIACYVRAIELGFSTAEVYNNLGFGHIQIYQLDEAQRSLDRAIELNPALQAAYRNRATADCLKATQPLTNYFPKKGLADIAEAIAMGPTSYDLYLDAAHLCHVASRTDACYNETAFDYLQKAVDCGLAGSTLERDMLLKPLQLDRRYRLLVRNPGQPNAPRAPWRVLNPTPEYPD